jgi:hypothetical protein
MTLQIYLLFQDNTAVQSRSRSIFGNSPLYAETIEAVKSRAALLASTPELISILGDTNSEARL